MKAVFIALIAFVLGFCSHLIIATIFTGPSFASTAYHWEALNDHLAHIQDPSNYESTPHDGPVAADIPYAPEPHLAALVAAGELEHIDIVFPTVPKTREATQLWMAFAEERRDTIIYAQGNPEHVDYKTSGDQPLHLHLWFKESGKSDVQQLIERIERLPAEGNTQVTKP